MLRYTVREPHHSYSWSSEFSLSRSHALEGNPRRKRPILQKRLLFKNRRLSRLDNDTKEQTENNFPICDGFGTEDRNQIFCPIDASKRPLGSVGYCQPSASSTLNFWVQPLQNEMQS